MGVLNCTIILIQKRQLETIFLAVFRKNRDLL